MELFSHITSYVMYHATYSGRFIPISMVALTLMNYFFYNLFFYKLVILILLVINVCFSWLFHQGYHRRQTSILCINDHYSSIFSI